MTLSLNKIPYKTLNNQTKFKPAQGAWIYHTGSQETIWLYIVKGGEPQSSLFRKMGYCYILLSFLRGQDHGLMLSSIYLPACELTIYLCTEKRKIRGRIDHFPQLLLNLSNIFPVGEGFSANGSQLWKYGDQARCYCIKHLNSSLETWLLGSVPWFHTCVNLALWPPGEATWFPEAHPALSTWVCSLGVAFCVYCALNTGRG